MTTLLADELEHVDVRTLPASARTGSRAALLVYAMLGVLFGVILTSAQLISWFRIQEMFRFQSFHMFGVLGSAVAVAMVGVHLLRRYGVRTITGAAITIPAKDGTSTTRYWVGGTIFGLGWALVGACPGPMFALIGTGVGTMVVALLSGLVGTWSYARLRHRLPH
jgi:uncharacterized protein